MDIDWLKEAYRRTREDGAVGVDGVTAEEYEQDWEGNLRSLLDRAKSGTYRAPPVRRVRVPKGVSTTETRPLGILPMLSNVFLHSVRDLWFEQEVKPRLQRHACLIRFANDFVIGFRDERDAQRVMEVIPKRFGKYGLTAHPTKTKLVRFRPPASKAQVGSGPDDRPSTFDLLGFTHDWVVSLKGHWVVKVKTAKDRFSQAVRSMDHWCRDHRHLSLRDQQQKLNQKLRGHDAYWGVTGNSSALSRFHHEVERRWRKWLNCRNRIRTMKWEKLRALLRSYPLAGPRAIHSVFRHAAKP